MKLSFKLLIIICLLGFSHKAFAQIDTLDYLKKFETNKTKYIGKPFSKLLKKMQYKIAISSLDNNGCYYGSSFGFSKNKKVFLSMNIVWENSIVADPSFFSRKKWLEVSVFTAEEKLFLEKLIIRDISVQNEEVSFGFLHCGPKKIPKEYAKYLSDNKTKYIGQRFEDFLCNVSPVFFDEYKHHYNEAGKVFKTIFFINYKNVYDQSVRDKESIQIIWKKPLRKKTSLGDNLLGIKEISKLKNEIISDIVLN